ncbi:MAG: glycine zipper 2TM domain-containing protein [Lentisphaeria bacterium]|nr:glycine zipper 2TM domain-containing protein [Lentisphaeria bacterium]
MTRCAWVRVSAMVLLSLAAGACVSSRSGQVYTRDDALRAQSAELGFVERVSPVRIEGTRSGAGTVVGGVAGGVAGSTVGSGRTAGVLGATVGAVVGGVVGTVAEEGITRSNGLELTVRLDSGRVLIVVQEDDEAFAIGDRVRVISAPDGKVRVRH